MADESNGDGTSRRSSAGRVVYVPVTPPSDLVRRLKRLTSQQRTALSKRDILVPTTNEVGWRIETNNLVNVLAHAFLAREVMSADELTAKEYSLEQLVFDVVGLPRLPEGHEEGSAEDPKLAPPAGEDALYLSPFDGLKLYVNDVIKDVKNGRVQKKLAIINNPNGTPRPWLIKRPIGTNGSSPRWAVTRDRDLLEIYKVGPDLKERTKSTVKSMAVDAAFLSRVDDPELTMRVMATRVADIAIITAEHTALRAQLIAGKSKAEVAELDARISELASEYGGTLGGFQDQVTALFPQPELTSGKN